MTKKIKCLTYIRSNYAHFSKKEKIIADYVFENPHKIIHWTINQLSNELNVAESTIVLFCKKIGFKGYQDLKIALASDLSSYEDDLGNKIQKEDSVESIADKVFNSNINTLKDTLSIQEEKSLYAAVSLILSSSKIHFFGVGGSSFIALDAYHKFMRCGLDVKIDLDSHLQIMSASLMTHKHTAIIISHSGSTKDILDIVQILKRNSVKIISVTNFASSTLSNEADVSLYTISDETSYRWDAISSRIAQLSILDTLYTLLMTKNKSKSLNARNKIRESISYKRL